MARIASLSSNVANTPFLVATRKNPNNPAQYQAMVMPGDLLLSLKPSDNLTITGLGTWFPLIANDLIWIYVVIDNYVATNATIQSYGLGDSGFTATLDAWDDSGGFVQDDGATPPNQIAANCMIAESTPDSKGNPTLTQKLFNNLVISNINIDGRPAIFPRPSSYGRYI